MKRLLESVNKFLADESGATLVEYGLLILIVAALSVLTVRTIGKKISNGFETVNSTLP